MAQVSRATHASDVATKLADNSSGDISEQDVREVITDLEDSVTWYDEANIVNDTTPQLGGSLDVNGQKIVSVSNGNIDIEPHGTGNVLLGNFTFNADQTVGASQDNYVLTYDHSAGTIGLETSAGGGSGYTQEEIEDFVGAMVTGNTETLIAVTYDDAGGKLNFATTATLSSYTNDAGFITAVTAPVTTVATRTGDVTLVAGDITSGTFADALIAASNVTQHQAALSVASSQITGTFGTSAYADESVTWAKLQHMATASFLGRNTASSGDVEVLSKTTALAILNVEDGADVTDATNVVAALSGATVASVTLTAPVVNVGVTTEASNRTLALTDASDVILMSSASANTVTVPTNASVAFPTGANITIVTTGAGTTTIAGDTGVTLQGNGGSVSAGSCDIQTRYGAATLIKIATDTWVVSGDIDGVA